MRRVMPCANAVVLAIVASLFLGSCASRRASPGYRDQAFASLARGSERGERGRSFALSPDSVRLSEFLGAYRYPSSPTSGAPVGARLVIGGTGGERERGEAWLMLALEIPAPPPASAPPRHWAIALDDSPSMGDGDRWSLAISAATRLIAALRPEDRVTLVLFGAEPVVHLQRVPPAEATSRIQELQREPTFRNDGHGNGLVTLGRVLLEESADGPSAAGFYVTDMEGATPDVPGIMRTLSDAGADIHVLGVAGGNEILLRQTAREGNGSYVFLADEAGVERSLARRLPESFDVALRDVRVSLWLDDGLELSAEDPEDDPYSIAAARPSGAKGERVVVPLTGGILGPGESWVRLWRIPNYREDQAASVRACVSGRDATGREHRVTVRPSAGWVSPTNRTPDARALLKAATIAREVRTLREALGGGTVYGRRPFGEVMAQVRAMADEMREAQKVLDDPEFARDLEALEAASRLTEADVARWRESRHGGPACGMGGLPGILGRVVALPFVVLACLFGA